VEFWLLKAKKNLKTVFLVLKLLNIAISNCASDALKKKNLSRLLYKCKLEVCCRAKAWI